MGNLLVSGCIARTAATEARKRLLDTAFALVIRAAMARTYVVSRELLRDSRGHGGEHLRHLLWTCMDHETKPVRNVPAQ